MAKAATTTKTTSTRKPATKQATGADVQAVLSDIQKRMGAAPAPAPAASNTAEGASATPPAAPHIDIARYVAALAQAAGFSKASIDLEMAVCLSIFAESGEANLAAKKEVLAAYSGAGWKCDTHTGDDYKTVSRRLNAAAALFDKMGGKKAIDEVTAGVPVEAHIGAIVNHLAATFELNSLNAVWAAAGRPVKNIRDWNWAERKHGVAPEAPKPAGEGAMAAGSPQLPPAPAPAAGAEAATSKQASNATVLEVGKLHLVIPFDTPYEDVVGMLTELMAFASKMEGAPQQPQEPATTPARKGRGATTH